MELHELLSKLEKSETFKKFKSENPLAFFCAGFFILDIKEGRNEYSLDYRSADKIFSFSIYLDSEAITSREDSILDSTKPLEEVNVNVKIQLSQLKELAKGKLAIIDVKKRLEKVIAVLQNSEGKAIWNLTCMCEGFAIIILHIDANTGEMISFDSKNLFDFVKMPKDNLSNFKNTPKG